MRVTHNSIAANVLANLQGNVSRLGETQQRLSSGKMLTRPSDSPAGTVAAMELRAQIAAKRQHVRNADDGLGWLNTADSALQDVSDQVIRARGLILQGMSAGSANPISRQALASEIRQIGDALRDVANTTYLDRPIFGGTTKASEAYSSTGAFTGNGEAVMRTVGANTKVAVNVDGRAIFGEGADSIFNVLASVANKLESDPSTLGAELTRLDTATATLRTGMSTIGARTNQLERMRQAANDAILTVTKSLSDIEDIDLPQTITELQLQETAYKVALAAGARVVQPSLADFLR
jgi:flagellar hook-associated protein 3 FlgL